MKKLFGFSALFIFMIMAGFVLATDMDITPDLITMDTTDVQTVDVCIEKSGGGPYVGVDLVIDTYCRDLNSNQVCDYGPDVPLPAGFSAVATSSPTDGTGCGEVTLTTSAATPGSYSYRVNGVYGGAFVDSESGLVLVPEFTTIGAGLVLAGAGFYMYRKRSKK